MAKRDGFVHHLSLSLPSVSSTFHRPIGGRSEQGGSKSSAEGPRASPRYSMRMKEENELPIPSRSSNHHYSSSMNNPQCDDGERAWRVHED